MATTKKASLDRNVFVWMTGILRTTQSKTASKNGSQNESLEMYL